MEEQQAKSFSLELEELDTMEAPLEVYWPAIYTTIGIEVALGIILVT